GHALPCESLSSRLQVSISGPSGKGFSHRPGTCLALFEITLLPCLKMRRHFTQVRAGAMFDKINPLPDAKLHPAVCDRDLQADRQDRGLKVGWHIIRSLGTMHQITD